MIIRYAYILFLGLIMATFIGVGIAAFYKSPQPPPPTRMPAIKTLDGTPSAEFEREQIVEQKKWEEYTKQQELYDRNVSAIAVGFAILLLIVSLVFVRQIAIISDGLLLGSVFTLIYSIARGFNSKDEAFRFVIVTIGLIVALFLGYIKFVKTNMARK